MLMTPAVEKAGDFAPDATLHTAVQSKGPDEKFVSRSRTVLDIILTASAKESNIPVQRSLIRYARGGEY
jgi:hypothetical protein